jgi:hypothetical protein
MANHDEEAEGMNPQRRASADTLRATEIAAIVWLRAVGLGLST